MPKPKSDTRSEIFYFKSGEKLNSNIAINKEGTIMYLTILLLFMKKNE